MPELPEVETVRRGLDRATPQLKILGGEVLRPSSVAFPLSASEFIRGVTGNAIVGWQRRGKYLLAELTCNETRSRLAVHLRMTGQLLWLSPDDALHKHTRVRLFFADDRELRFVDQRTFGQLWWVPPDTDPATIVTGLQRLGPEPLSDSFSIEYFRDRLKDRRRPIKTALLDQAIVAGVGNIYADESLFLAGINPTTPCYQLNETEIDRLRDRVRTVLQTAIDAGGTTFSNFLNVEGTNGNYGGVAWVYDRGGQPCRVCQTPLQKIKLAGRSSCFCPKCQSQGSS